MPDFELVKTDLSSFSLKELNGKNVILNIFPSLDTGVCATSVRKFNKLAAGLPDTVVLTISKDLPFAHARFCTTEGIENVIPLSDFRFSDFDENYGVRMADGPLSGLLARAVEFVVYGDGRLPIQSWFRKLRRSRIMIKRLRQLRNKPFCRLKLGAEKRWMKTIFIHRFSIYYFFCFALCKSEPSNQYRNCYNDVNRFHDYIIASIYDIIRSF